MKFRWSMIVPVLAVILVGGVLAGLYWTGGTFFSEEENSEQSSSAQPSGLPLPTREEETALVSETMRTFARALVQKDFNSFYGSTSAAWQKQILPEDMAAAFKHFLPFAREVQTAVTADDPFFNAPPSINEKKVLTVQGFYRIEGTKMLFNLQYIREKDAWKLFGMNLDVK
ncbi:MAG: hypothetical protein PHX93_00795 [Candidatus Peribacteraceae bacterium]|jgi:hypothetical protein|nr:hypothetical protein [Candidatus Peribacteraceae bacterium]